MEFNPKSITKGSEKRARKLVIYGPPKTGKSTLAGAARNALLIPTEDRVSHVDCAKAPICLSYDEVDSIVKFFLSDKNEDKNGKKIYTRLILDTLDWFEPMLWEKVCQTNGFKSLTEDANKETNFGKGLGVHAVDGWKKFLYNLDILVREGIDVIFVAHSGIVKINPPNLDEYDKYVIDINKSALSVIEEWADVIAFYNKEIFVKSEIEGKKKKSGKAVSANTRKLYLSGSNASMISGNSYGLPDVLVHDVNDCPDIMEWLLTGTGNGEEEE